MKAMIDFFGTMLKLPKPWIAWVMLLMTAKLIVPLFYLDTLEGKVILATALLGAIVQTAIFSANGFVRLLGIGHIVLVSLSLLIDATDVIRYLRGEREPQVVCYTPPTTHEKGKPGETQGRKASGLRFLLAGDGCQSMKDPKTARDPKTTAGVPGVYPGYGFVTNPDYRVDEIAISGDGLRIWFVLYDFYEDPQYEV